MTEEEWLHCNDLGFIIRTHLVINSSQRRRSLFCAACCRLMATRLDDRCDQSLFEATERYAEGLTDNLEHRQFCEAVQIQIEEYASREQFEKAYAAIILRDCARLASRSEYLRMEEEEASFRQCQSDPVLQRDLGLDRITILDEDRWQRLPKEAMAYLRDIFGNPFRPVTNDPAWLTWRDGTIPKLAQAAYEERELPSGHLDVKRLAILADALEEAGCTNEDVLAHLRGPGPHVRGCWVVDLVLGKD